ncbi:MAG: hypothetical protein ACKOWN_02715 [Microbacteriaceae bacterium]
MKKPFINVRLRSPRPRTWLGIALIGISIAGTVWVVADSRAGTGIVLAREFIPAGHVLVESDVESARLVSDSDYGELVSGSEIGRRTAVDIAPGEIITARVLDATSVPRKIVSVPIEFTPSAALAAGTRIELWFIGTAQGPAEQIARDAFVVSSRRGSFGDGTVVDLSVDARDAEHVLGSLGADGQFTMTLGDNNS